MAELFPKVMPRLHLSAHTGLRVGLLSALRILSYRERRAGRAWRRAGLCFAHVSPFLINLACGRARASLRQICPVVSAR